MDPSVRVWLIRTDLPEPRLAELADVLDDAERDRAASLAPGPGRRRYVATRGAVRLILADLLRCDPTELRWRRGTNGKPALVGRGLETNLSHSGDLAALAATGGGRVGVDVQGVAPRLDTARMAWRYFPPAEAAFVAEAGGDERAGRFFSLWVRKEACLKAAGGRLIQGLRLPVQGDAPVLVRDPGGPLPGPYLVRDVAVPEGFHAAVAVEGGAEGPVASAWWSG